MHHIDFNVTKIFLETMPDCEQFIIDCKWEFSPVNCCDVFKIQKTAFGFCYSFNSLTSENNDLTEPRTTRLSGLRSNLQLSLNSENLSIPPDTGESVILQLTCVISIPHYYVHFFFTFS